VIGNSISRAEGLRFGGGRGVIDASALLLAILALAAPCVTVVGALKVYCILAAMGLAGVAAVCLARAPAGRYALAVAGSAIP
jgi:hypothetical protein